MRLLASLQRIIWDIKEDHAGAVSAEYAFLLAFIAIVATLGMVLIGPSIADYFEAVTRTVPDTSVIPPCPLGCT